jgi:glycosyltransferase involved in cell wall biosynthesis
MRVIINLHPLGGTSKTGVFRVADEIAQGLGARLTSNLIAHSITSTYHSHLYFRKYLYPLKCYAALNTISSIFLPISKIVELINRKLNHNSGVVFRIARKITMLTQNSLDLLASRIPENILANSDIYHSPFSKIPNQIRSRKRIKRFITIHDLIPITNPEFFDKKTVIMVREIMESLDKDDHVFCVSKATRTTLLKYSVCDPDKVLVIPLAASNHFYPAKDLVKNQKVLRKYGIQINNYILTLCTLEIRKNIEIVIRAFIKLHVHKLIPPNTHLVLVGGKGWKTKNIEAALSAAAPFRDKILMPGFIPDEDIAVIYSSAKVFVYMSYLEGFGLPPLEAMQCGTPVITSNTSSLPEVVGTGGTMLNPDDIDGLIHELHKIYRTPAYHHEMSNRALERSRHFSWERFISHTLDAYQAALHK